MKPKMRPAKWRELETYLLSSRDLAPSTTDKTLRKLRALERAGVDLQRPRRAAYDAFLADRKKRGRDGPGSRHYGRAMKHLLAWRGIHWPDFRLPRATAIATRELIPDAALYSLLHYHEEDDDADQLDIATARSAFNIAFVLALRLPSELHDLSVDDVHVEDRRVTIYADKTERADVIELAEWEMKHLTDYMRGPRAKVACQQTRPVSLILHPWTGRPFSREGLRMFLWRHGRRVWPRFYGYAIRHAAITWTYMQTKDAFYTMSRARHAKLNSTQVYVHAAEAIERRRAAAPLVRPFTLATG